MSRLLVLKIESGAIEVVERRNICGRVEMPFEVLMNVWI